MPKIRITQTDLTGNVQQAAISNTVFVPVRATKDIAPTLVTSIESFASGELASVKKDSLGYALCKHLLGIGLPILVQGVKGVNSSYTLSERQWNALTDKNLYPIRFLTYGDLTGDRLCQDMINVANARKDCVALLDMDESNWSSESYDVAKIRANIDGAVTNGEFAAAFTPWFYSKVSDLQIPGKAQILELSNVTDTSKIANLMLKYVKPADDINYEQVVGQISGKDSYPSLYKASFTEHLTGSYVVKYESKDTEVQNLTDADYVNLANTLKNIDAISEQEAIDYYNSATINKYIRTMSVDTTLNAIPTNTAGCYVKTVRGDFIQLAKFNTTIYTQLTMNEDDNTTSIGTKIPAAFGYLFAYANSIKNNPEWYAVAGFDRGIIPELSSTTYNYNASDIEILQARAKDRVVDLDAETDNVGIAINPIAYIRPAGYIIYGNRTLRSNSAAKGTIATSFLNVRNLISAVTKVMYDGAKKYTFEQNNDLLWLNFQAYVRPTLEKMKSGNGIADYSFVKESTPAKARLKAKVNIIPIEAVEDFDLSIIMTDDETLISGE